MPSHNQTEIALSTACMHAEAEYIALSQALREVIPLILVGMMKELKQAFPIYRDSNSKLQLQLYSARRQSVLHQYLHVATTQKFPPRTKHIALKYHHFRSYVSLKQIEIHYINTHDQLELAEIV